MEALIVLALYAGCFIFALNGLLMMGMKAERIKLKAQEERLRRILMRLRR
jgi:hypothetical protein